MSPDEERDLLSAVREIRGDMAFVKANSTIIGEQVITLARTQAEHGVRITNLETGGESRHRALSHSVTSEIGDKVGESIRAAAPDLGRAVERGSIVRNVVSGIVLALAILAAIVFHH